MCSNVNAKHDRLKARAKQGLSVLSRPKPQRVQNPTTANNITGQLEYSRSMVFTERRRCLQ